MRRSVSLSAVGFIAFALIGLATGPAWADDPLYGIDPTVSSTTVVISTASVDPSASEALVKDLVASGPYNQGTPGFMDETISQGLSNGGTPVDVFAVAVFQSPKVAATATASRKRALTAQTQEPAVITATVLEHLLANWGWENGREVRFLRVVPGQPTTIFDDYNNSLAFFKSGYTGQMSMLEFFQPGVALEAVRSELTRRRGMSGASIYRDDTSGNFIAYSQYFDTTSALASRPGSSLVADRRMGQVVQNYRAR